jgi:hypothetical protein
MSYEKVYKARKIHLCYSCLKPIDKGERYTRSTLFPSEEPMISSKPVNVPFCYKCIEIKEEP